MPQNAEEVEKCLCRGDPGRLRAGVALLVMLHSDTAFGAGATGGPGITNRTLDTGMLTLTGPLYKLVWKSLSISTCTSHLDHWGALCGQVPILRTLEAVSCHSAVPSPPHMTHHVRLYVPRTQGSALSVLTSVPSEHLKAPGSEQMFSNYLLLN